MHRPVSAMPAEDVPLSSRSRSSSERSLPADWFLRSRLKLRHLTLFLALDQHRNLHRAATILNMSQPAASKMLGEVEKALGVSLFDRLPRGVEPTWYGEILIRHARTILAELGQAGDELDALITGHGGSVAIGAVTAPAIDSVAEAVKEVRRAHPDLRVSLETDTSDGLIARLLESHIDFAVARIPRSVDPTAFAYEEVGEEELACLVRDGHPLADAGPLDAATLARQPWVLQPRGRLLRSHIDAYFAGRGVAPPRDVVDTASVLISLAMIARTDAVTAVARSVANFLATPGQFRALDTVDRLSVEPFGIVRRRDKPLSPGAQRLYEAVRAQLLPAGS